MKNPTRAGAVALVSAALMALSTTGASASGTSLWYPADHSYRLTVDGCTTITVSGNSAGTSETATDGGCSGSVGLEVYAKLPNGSYATSTVGWGPSSVTWSGGQIMTFRVHH